MPVTVGIKFGSYDFSTKAYLTAGKWSVKSDVRLKQHIIARREGGIIDLARLNPIVVTIEGDISGTSHEDLRTNVDAFLAAMRNGKQDLYLYSDRYIKDAQVTTLSNQYDPALTLYRYKMRLVGANPFVQSTSAQQDIEVISATPTTYTPNSPDGMEGNAFALPVITIDADQTVIVTNIALENLTTLQKLAYTGSVAVNDALVIDCDAHTVENNGVNDLANFSGDFLELIAGANSIKYTGPDCTITFDWTDCWYVE